MVQVAVYLPVVVKEPGSILKIIQNTEGLDRIQDSETQKLICNIAEAVENSGEYGALSLAIDVRRQIHSYREAVIARMVLGALCEFFLKRDDVFSASILTQMDKCLVVLLRQSFYFK